MDKNKIVEEIEKVAIEEFKKNKVSTLWVFHIANLEGLRIAKELKADEFVVQLGTRLMDFKLPEAIKNNKLSQYVEMSIVAAKEFLVKYNLDNFVYDKVINSIAAHHKEIEWNSLESEICANADCYKFLKVKNWLKYLHTLSGRGYGFEEAYNMAKAKFIEKLKILSLDFCKQDLKDDIEIIQNIIKEVEK